MTAAGAGLSPFRQVLANGVTTLVKETRVTPAVTIHVAIHAGSTSDPAHLPGLASFLSRMIDRGTSSMSAAAIAEELESRGVSLATTVNRHVLSLACTCLVEDFTAILAIVADCLRHPVFPGDQIATRRGEMITSIRQDEDNPAAVAMAALMEDLYGCGHPYGHRVRGTVAGAEKITRADLVAFHASHVVPASTVVAIVGDIEPAEAVRQCGEVFGDWTGSSPTSLELAAAAPRTGRHVRVIPMMNKAQTDVAYGFTSIRHDDPDYYACWVMNNVLGEYSIGGRLGDSIRERQGMAYYVHSSLDANVIPGPLAIRAGVAATNVERAIAAIDHEVDALSKDGPTEKELHESKQYLIGSLPRTLETNAGIAAFLQTIEFFGLGLDYDVRLPSLLQVVTREDVHRAARRLLDSGRAAVVVAGPYTGTVA